MNSAGSDSNPEPVASAVYRALHHPNRPPAADRPGSSPSPHLPRILQALRDAAHHQSDVDYYRLYFMTQALAAAGGTDADLAARLRDALVVCQADTGDQTGSFEAQDRWSSAGGRVYATAMAVLAM